MKMNQTEGRSGRKKIEKSSEQQDFAADGDPAWTLQRATAATLAAKDKNNPA